MKYFITFLLLFIPNYKYKENKSKLQLIQQQIIIDKTIKDMENNNMFY